MSGPAMSAVGNRRSQVGNKSTQCVRAKAAPLVYDHIVENVSNVSMCQQYLLDYHK